MLAIKSRILRQGWNSFVPAQRPDANQQESLLPDTEPVQPPDARLGTRLSPQQWPHPPVQKYYQSQLKRYLAMLQQLNAGHSYGVEKWTKTIGPLSDTHHFGDSVFNGMVNIWPAYLHRLKLESYQTLFVGWFRCPEPFSKQRAQRPPTEDDAHMRFLPQLTVFRCCS